MTFTLLIISLSINITLLFYLNRILRVQNKKLKHTENLVSKYTSTDVGNFYNEQTDNFIQVYGEVIQAFRTKDVNKLLDYQIDVIGIKEGMTILDAGCGVCGPAIYFAKKTRANIEAVTISDIQATKAINKIKLANLTEFIHVKSGDYHLLNQLYAKEQFDCIYFLESFGHAHSHQQVLYSAWEVLKPGGKIYIKDLFIKKAMNESLQAGILNSVEEINIAYRYNVPDLNDILDMARKKGYILSQIKTIDIALEDFENLTISNEFQELTGIHKIENLRNYIFPVDFFELILLKPNFDMSKGNSRYFLQNMYLMQIEKWNENEL